MHRPNSVLKVGCLEGSLSRTLGNLLDDTLPNSQVRHADGGCRAILRALAFHPGQRRDSAERNAAQRRPEGTGGAWGPVESLLDVGGVGPTGAGSNGETECNTLRELAVAAAVHLG